MREAGRGRVKERGNGRGDPCSTALTLRAGVNTSHIPRHREKHMEGPTRALAFEQSRKSSIPRLHGQERAPSGSFFLLRAPPLRACARACLCACGLLTPPVSVCDRMSRARVPAYAQASAQKVAAESRQPCLILCAPRWGGSADSRQEFV